MCSSCLPLSLLAPGLALQTGCLPLQVFAMWDVVVMPRVEEASMQCAAPGVPVELVDLDDAESVLGSSHSLDAPEVLELAELPRPHLASPGGITRPRISQSV